MHLGAVFVFDGVSLAEVAMSAPPLPAARHSQLARMFCFAQAWLRAGDDRMFSSNLLSCQCDSTGVYFAAVAPHASQRHHQCFERHTMFVHCAGRNTACGKRCMHSVHANRAFVVIIHTHDNAHWTWTHVTSAVQPDSVDGGGYNQCVR